MYYISDQMHFLRCLCFTFGKIITIQKTISVVMLMQMKPRNKTTIPPFSHFHIFLHFLLHIQLRQLPPKEPFFSILMQRKIIHISDKSAECLCMLLMSKRRKRFINIHRSY